MKDYLHLHMSGFWILLQIGYDLKKNKTVSGICISYESQFPIEVKLRGTKLQKDYGVIKNKTRASERCNSLLVNSVSKQVQTHTHTHCFVNIYIRLTTIANLHAFNFQNSVVFEIICSTKLLQRAATTTTMCI